MDTPYKQVSIPKASQPQSIAPLEGLLDVTSVYNDAVESGKEEGCTYITELEDGSTVLAIASGGEPEDPWWLSKMSTQAVEPTTTVRLLSAPITTTVPVQEEYITIQATDGISPSPEYDLDWTRTEGVGNDLDMTFTGADTGLASADYKITLSGTILFEGSVSPNGEVIVVRILDPETGIKFTGTTKVYNMDRLPQQAFTGIGFSITAYGRFPIGARFSMQIAVSDIGNYRLEEGVVVIEPLETYVTL